MVTSNLWKLLRDIRQADTDRYLWIDAISINQDDDLERGHQVQRMQVIYSGAERVLFYLGETTGAIQNLMNSLSALQSQTLGCRWASDDPKWKTVWDTIRSKRGMSDGNMTDGIQKRGLEELLARPWFRRVWILQEVANSRRALLCCGRGFIHAQIFALSPRLLGVLLDDHSRAVFELMPTYSQEGPRKLPNPDFGSVLVNFRRAVASDPRDRIFALIGLCADSLVREVVKPDYTSYESHVIAAAVNYFMLKDFGRSLEPIPELNILYIDGFLSKMVLKTQIYRPLKYIEKALIQFFGLLRRGLCTIFRQPKRVAY
ncbi:heterokaryon incompatibility protein-domain-containing protein [Nemania serpens]|nr:heterokaryon incompatibility protein-domain-containing protein [Nemania serpens]